MNADITGPFCDRDGEDPNAVPPSPDDFAAVWGSPGFPPAVLSNERNAELMRVASPTQMNGIEAMKHACVEALEINELGPGEAAVYASVVDPVSVLALIDIVEKSITDEEIRALHQVIKEMGDYIRKHAASPDADRLFLRARQLVGLTVQA